MMGRFALRGALGLIFVFAGVSTLLGFDPTPYLSFEEPFPRDVWRAFGLVELACGLLLLWGRTAALAAVILSALMAAVLIARLSFGQPDEVLTPALLLVLLAAYLMLAPRRPLRLV